RGSSYPGRRGRERARSARQETGDVDPACSDGGRGTSARGGGVVIGAFASRADRMVRLLWLVEALLLGLSVVATIWLRFPDDPEWRALLLQRGRLPALVVATALTLSMAAFGLYQAHLRLNRMELLVRL